MTILYAIVIGFQGANSSPELLAITGSSSRTYGLYETIEECETQAKTIKGNVWTTCVPLPKSTSWN